MSGNRCDGCGNDVPVAGGIANLWRAEQTNTGGLTLEFPDGSEHFLCYHCINALPDNPTATDVDALTDTTS